LLREPILELTFQDVLGTTSSEYKPSFEELFLPQLDAAYNLAYWIVGGDQDAQDVVQEAYVRAFKGFSGFRGNNASLAADHCPQHRLQLDQEEAS